MLDDLKDKVELKTDGRGPGEGGSTQVIRGIVDVPRNRVPLSPLW